MGELTQQKGRYQTMSLSVRRFKDSTAVLFLSLGRSFEQSVKTFEKRVVTARKKAHVRCVNGCISRHSTRDGFPASMSVCDISERIGSLPEELREPLQVLMDERAVLCFNTDRRVLAEVLDGDCVRVMRQNPHFAETYWAQQLRVPRLSEYRIRNLNRLPADVDFERLRFISSRISKR